MEWLEKIRRRAEQEGLDADELTDTLLHRTFCLQRPKFDEELGVTGYPETSAVRKNKASEGVASQEPTAGP